MYACQCEGGQMGHVQSSGVLLKEVAAFQISRCPLLWSTAGLQ